ncbi:uncharacterized protein LOC127103734 [Lathyrus oleraceus]|uniref:uncharacterized protein LOC127103734 n=1 Tax=Pisum sativum TaxID=3888 RepID=UPI0021D3DCFE|nr:uncharacterized protein LOC127103734 [Pisum sativum]
MDPTPKELSKIATTQVESDNSSPRVEGDKGDATQTAAKSPFVPVLLNSVGEPTYHLISAKGLEKSSMSEINQPIAEECETSPPKITIQHSHTSGSDHEIDSSRETQAEVNKDAMVVDEEVYDSGGGSPDVDGTNNTVMAGNDDQDEEMREEEEEEEEYQSLFHDGRIGEDDEDLEEEDNNCDGNKDDNIKTNEGQP